MRDPKDQLSDAALAEKLFKEARDDGVAIHPAVGVRIEKQIEHALSRRRSRWRLLRLWPAVVAVLLFAGLLSTRWESMQAVESERAPVETLVRARERSLEIELGPGKRAQLHPASSLITSEPPEVLEGEVEFRVAQVEPGETFEVRAADVSIRVVGTIFTVRRLGDQVDVKVAEGVVHVFVGSVEAIVAAGAAWSNAPVAAQAAVAEVDPVEPTDGPSRVSRLLEQSYRRVTHEKPEAPAQGTLEKAPAQLDLPSPPYRRSLLEAAAAHLRAGEIDRARAIYRELQEGDPSDAALGFYLIARLESLHAGRPEAALSALDEFLRRFPHHALAEEAEASRIEAQLDLARCDEAAAALQQFERNHGGASQLVARSRSRLKFDCRKKE